MFILNCLRPLIYLIYLCVSRIPSKATFQFHVLTNSYAHLTNCYYTIIEMYGLVMYD